MTALALSNSGYPWLTVALTASILSVAFHERKASTWHLGAAAFILMSGIFFLFIPSLWLSVVFSFALMNLIGFASMAKFRNLGFNLVAGDLFHHLKLGSWTVWAEYRTNVVLVAISICSTGALIIFGRNYVDDYSAPLLTRFYLLLGCMVIYGAAFLVSGGRKRFSVGLLTQNRAHVSAFFASLFGAGPGNRLQMSDVGAEALPLLPSVAGRLDNRNGLPDIYLILSESTFDPRVIGMKTPDFAKSFFNPEHGISGTLHVDVFGGSTWQSEFAVYSGLSSRSFGPNSRFVFQLLKNRIKHALPTRLNSLGYRSVIVCADGSEANPLISHRDFYRSIGFERICFPVDRVKPENLGQWKRERHDAQTFDGALSLRSEEIGREQPLFLSIMTYMNHGSHRRRRFPPKLHADIRAEALAASGRLEYAEYCVRLAESVRAYNAFRAAIEKDAVTRPALIVRYGDHQPSFVSKFLKCQPDDPRLRQTYFAIEGIGIPLAPVNFNTDQLDATMLSVVALASAGMPLDAIDATRLSLAAECGTDYFSSQSEMKFRFHRTLLETGNLVL
jgi:hypothetical protein